MWMRMNEIALHFFVFLSLPALVLFSLFSASSLCSIHFLSSLLFHCLKTKRVNLFRTACNETEIFHSSSMCCFPIHGRPNLCTTNGNRTRSFFFSIFCHWRELCDSINDIQPFVQHSLRIHPAQAIINCSSFVFLGIAKQKETTENPLHLAHSYSRIQSFSFPFSFSYDKCFVGLFKLRSKNGRSIKRINFPNAIELECSKYFSLLSIWPDECHLIFDALLLLLCLRKMKITLLQSNAQKYICRI